MRAKTALMAVVLLGAVGLYFATRAPEVVLPDMTGVEVPGGEEEGLSFDLVSPGEGSGADSTAEAVRRNVVAEEAEGEVAAGVGSDVLRVTLEGVTEEEALLAKITVALRDQHDKRIVGIEGSWMSEGLTSEFDLDPLLARVAEQSRDRRVDVLVVEVDAPEHVSEKVRVSLAGDAKPSGSVYEVRVPLAQPEFWPEFTLAVRDAHTREHLEDVELRFTPGATTAMWGRNSVGTLFGDHLVSPITLMGGRNAEDPEAPVAHLGVRPGAGEAIRLVKLAYATRAHFGFVVSARAPGYSWGSIALDFTKSEERELLLKPGSGIDVRLTNVQLEQYRALETQAVLCVYWIREDGGSQYVHFAPLDEALESDGLLLEGLKPGGYRVAVELDGGSWAKRPMLALEEISLEAGTPREVELALDDPPALPDNVTVGGLLSFPAFGGEEDVRLQLFQGNWGYGVAPVELSLDEMVRVGGALPTWSFRLEDIPVGTCQIRLMPFLKNWMVEVPEGGRDDVALVIPELAEVRVETVDAGSGERVPLEKLRYVFREDLPGRVHNIWSDQIWTGFDEEPGLFRLWMAPGTGYITSWEIPKELGYASSYKDLEFVPGLQSVQLELAPPCRIYFDIRVDGGEPKLSDGIWDWVHYGTLECVQAVDHEGRCKGRVGERLTEVSAPGIYEVSFDELTRDLFHPIPTRLVDVRAGETAEVVVELQRK